MKCKAFNGVFSGDAGRVTAPKKTRRAGTLGFSF
jgi:hypothetical protein